MSPVMSRPSRQCLRTPAAACAPQGRHLKESSRARGGGRCPNRSVGILRAALEYDGGVSHSGESLRTRRGLLRSSSSCGLRATCLFEVGRSRPSASAIERLRPLRVLRCSWAADSPAPTLRAEMPAQKGHLVRQTTLLMPTGAFARSSAPSPAGRYAESRRLCDSAQPAGSYSVRCGPQSYQTDTRNRLLASPGRLQPRSGQSVASSQAPPRDLPGSVAPG